VPTPLRVLTWNLYHGRAVPDRPRSLLPEFCARIAGWGWDVALLQEVPPWWPPELARTSGAAQRTALTSRNLGLPLRRLIAERRPDLIKSNGGGANAILVRGATIVEHRVRRLRWWPERRVVHAVCLQDGRWIANVHAHVRPHTLTRADLALAGATVRRWAGPAPVLLGGDTNVPDPHVDGFADAGGHEVDRFLVRGLQAATPPRTLERDGLSDHAPVLVSLTAPPSAGLPYAAGR
jgi:endonuclease/exonuclease/phosphatase family metal-dependent hydrolase